MTQDEIIRMAREAGALDKGFGASPLIEFTLEELERFAALVAAHERERMWCDAEFARQQEREACAKVCDELKWHSPPNNFAENCAAAIRARGEK